MRQIRSLLTFIIEARSEEDSRAGQIEPVESSLRKVSMADPTLLPTTDQRV